jgi:HD-GYP domain-containing protein (c-di-GMP phosphodiesterase class II)
MEHWHPSGSPPLAVLIALTTLKWCCPNSPPVPRGPPIQRRSWPSTADWKYRRFCDTLLAIHNDPPLANGPKQRTDPMWKKPETPIPIDVSQVVIGLYIWLDLSWDDHPFLYGRFMVRDEQQIQTLGTLKLEGKLYYYAEKSKAVPGPVCKKPAQQPTAAVPDPEAELEKQLAAQKKEKQDQLQRRKDAAARADRAWEQAARVAREAMLQMARQPRQAGAQLRDLSQKTASMIVGAQEILLHLLGDKQGEGPQFHALNVMTLSMLLGKTLRLTEEQLAEVALGAMAHDIGKTRVPAHILKAKNRPRHEEDFYREHVGFGVTLAEESGAFGPVALSILADHHECMDGSGWPMQKKSISPAVSIVALANRYDRLCSPESPERDGLMPAEALSRLFRSESGKFDKQHLSLLIKLLGVFPPGTIVRLNDESLGLVVAPGADSLKPTVLVYAPDVHKRDAPTIDLAQTDGLKIEEALRPSSIPADVLAWLNPRQRLSYFFSTEPAN